MSNISIQSFRTAALRGHAALDHTPEKDPSVVSAKRTLAGRALDWLAGGILKNTDWAQARTAKSSTRDKLAFYTFVTALKKEYGTKDKKKLALGKALREAVGGQIPKLDKRTVEKLESVAKNFKGSGEARDLKRNLVVRWWESKGLDHPGHAAAGIRNRVGDPNAEDKYVSFWPGKSAGGKGEVFGKAQEGSLSEHWKDDYTSELAGRTKERLEDSRLTRAELQMMNPLLNKFFSSLRGIGPETPKQKAMTVLRDALENLAKGVKFAYDKEGKLDANQSSKAQMTLDIVHALNEYEENKITLSKCMSQVKGACKTYSNTLGGYAKYEPRARQVAITDNDKNVYWGLKAEKFFIPLAGKNESLNGTEKFLFFGLNEAKMNDRHEELTDKGPIAEARAQVLRFEPELVEPFWNKHQHVSPLTQGAADLRDAYGRQSEEGQALQQLLDKADTGTLEGAVRFLADLQNLVKGWDHQLPYKMVSKSDNCAGYITGLMEQGGAGVFASKPTVAVATSPNDTADWAKRVLAETDRLNGLAGKIMERAGPNYLPTTKQVEEGCPPDVLKAYRPLFEMKNGNGEIAHDVLMAGVKKLVEAISGHEGGLGRLGAFLLQDIQPLYDRAGNPV